MARKSKEADPFAKVSTEEKEKYEWLSEEQINAEIATIAKNGAALEEAKLQDTDLVDRKEKAKKAREQVKIANEPYAAEAIRNRQRIGLLRRMLSDKGKPTGDAGVGDDMAEVPEKTEVGTGG